MTTFAYFLGDEEPRRVLSKLRREHRRFNEHLLDEGSSPLSGSVILLGRKRYPFAPPQEAERAAQVVWVTDSDLSAEQLIKDFRLEVDETLEVSPTWNTTFHKRPTTER